MVPSDDSIPNLSSDEEKEAQSQSPVIPFEQYSDFNRVTAWILLSKNCKQKICLTPSLSTNDSESHDYFGEALKHA